MSTHMPLRTLTCTHTEIRLRQRQQPKESRTRNLTGPEAVQLTRGRNGSENVLSRGEKRRKNEYEKWGKVGGCIVWHPIHFILSSRQQPL